MRAYAAKVKDDMRNTLEEKVKEGARVSLTTDELTKMHKKWANLNIHLPGGETMSIGLMRIRGRLPAERAKAILCKKLNEFGLSEDRHLVATTKDGESVMKKMGRLFKCLSQLCHAHGLHLAGIGSKD